MNSSSSPIRGKNEQQLGRGRQWLEFFNFRERRTSFSLDFRSIEQSVFDGARKKVVLCD